MSKATSYKLFVKPWSVSAALHVLFAFVLTILEPITDVAPQSVNTSPNQIKLIVEDKLVHFEFATTQEAHPMNIKDTKPTLNLDIDLNQETKNLVEAKIPLVKAEKETKATISEPITDTDPQDPVMKPSSGLPRVAVNKYNRNFEALALAQEFSVDEKPVGVTNNETQTKSHAVKETIETIEKQQTRELNPPMALPKAPPKRPKNLNQGHQTSTALSALMLRPENRKQPPKPQHFGQRQHVEHFELTKNPVETKARALDENETFSILKKNRVRGDTITTDQAPSEETRHIAPDISIPSKMKQQLRDWAKLESIIGIEPEELKISAPTANMNFPSINQRALGLAATQTKMSTKNPITRLKQSDKEPQNSCKVSRAEYKGLNLEAINAIIKSKTTQIGQLLGQKLYPHQTARNQNIGNLLAQQTGAQAQQQNLGTLSISQLIALRNMAARQQIFLCQ